MPLYLKIALPVAGLILGIFSLSPEGARSQQPLTRRSRRYRTGADPQGSSSGAAGTEENGPRPLRRLQPKQCGAIVGGFDQSNKIADRCTVSISTATSLARRGLG